MADVTSSDEHHVTSTPSDPPVKPPDIRTPQDELSDNNILGQKWSPVMTNPTAHTASSILCVPDEALRRISQTTQSASLEVSGPRYLTTEAQSRLKRQSVHHDEELPGSQEVVMQSTMSDFQLLPGQDDSFSQAGPVRELRYSFGEQQSAHWPPPKETTSPKEAPEEEEEVWKEEAAENLPAEKGSLDSPTPTEWVLASPPPSPPPPMLPPPPAEGEWVTPLIALEREWVPPPTPPPRGRGISPMSSLERDWVSFPRMSPEREWVTLLMPRAKREQLISLMPPTERESQVALSPSQVLPVLPQPLKEEPPLAAPEGKEAATLQPLLPDPEPQPEEEGTPPRPSPSQEPVISWATATKTEADTEKVSKGTSPSKDKPPAVVRSGKEIVSRMETKAWPVRVDPASSDMTHFKPKGTAFSQRGKDKAFHDAMEDINSQIKEATTSSRSSMSNSISSFVDSSVGKVFAKTIDRALGKSEEWLNYYLPMPETSTAGTNAKKEERDTSKDDLCKEGCFMRISFLSTQLRNRAFRFVLHQLKSTRRSTNEQLSRLDQVLDTLDQSLSPGPSSFQKVSESLSNVWSQWNTKQDTPSQKQSSGVIHKSLSLLPEQLERKALGLTQVLAEELYTTYRNLLPHVTELPAHLQEKVTRVYQNMEELHSHLSAAGSLKDLPSSIILQSRERIAAARENLDELLDFMVQSQPAQWLSQPSTSRTASTLSPAAGSRPPIAGSVESKAKEEGSTSQQQPPPHP